MKEQDNKYAEGLNMFFRLSKDDTRLSATHISLYVALFRYWLKNNGNSPFKITRKAIMTYSKIKSTATYTHCIYDLQTWGYITYIPSYHPALGSLVILK